MDNKSFIEMIFYHFTPLTRESQFNKKTSSFQ